jgi:hypothetical protein
MHLHRASRPGCGAPAAGRLDLDEPLYGDLMKIANKINPLEASRIKFI